MILKRTQVTIRLIFFKTILNIFLLSSNYLEILYVSQNVYVNIMKKKNQPFKDTNIK